MTHRRRYYGRGELYDTTGRARTLVVLVHGSGGVGRRAQRAMLGTMEVAREVFPSSDFYIPRLKLEFWRLRDARAIVRRLSDAIEHIWQDRKAAGEPYTDVILIGYSFGAVITRRLYCEARGADNTATLQPHLRKEWSSAVKRIVLRAGMNRGWTVESPVNRLQEGIVRVATAVAHVVALLREPTMFAIRRGAPFLTTMRLQWLAVMKQENDPPTTVQLLGTRDDLVSPADNIDLATGNRFFYLEVPHSDHFDVFDMSNASMNTARSLRKRTAAAERRRVMRVALGSSEDVLKNMSLKPADLSDFTPFALDDSDDGAALARRRQVQHVVFVMHGIRDKGFWTQKVARHVKQAAPPSWRMQSWPSTYGYFAMGPFLVPWARRIKVEWFMDQYVAARALYPTADFSFIGHSNGTYLFGSALQRCEAVQFHHAVLAGSVLRSNFRWPELVSRSQIKAVRNYVATADWVVAMFPRLFQLVRLADLGSSGHDGFDPERPPVRNVQYIRGHHSAALDEARWPRSPNSSSTGRQRPRPDKCQQRRPTSPIAAIPSW